MLCIHNIHTRVCFNVFGSFGGLTERPRIVIESPFPTWKKKCRQTKAKSNNSGPIITIRELPLCECLSGYLPASLYIRYVSRPHAAAAATGKISRQKNSFFSFFSFLLFPNLFYCQHFKWSSIDLRFFFNSFEGKKNPVDKSLRAGEKKKKRWVHGPSVKKKKKTDRTGSVSKYTLVAGRAGARERKISEKGREGIGARTIVM